jgi:hypothetical protein
METTKPIAIYLVLDDAERPRYVGRSVRPRVRIMEHARRHVWAHSLRILEWVPLGVRWQERERYWIRYYRRFSQLENVNDGGGACIVKSEETKRRFREKMTGRRHSPETLVRIRDTVRRRSPEQQAEINQRISAAKKGKVPKWSPEGKQRTIDMLKRRGSPMEGKKHSPETIALLRIKNKRPPNAGSFQLGKPNPKSDAWRQAMSRVMTGRKLSEETKQKIREKRALQDMSSRWKGDRCFTG